MSQSLTVNSLSSIWPKSSGSTSIDTFFHNSYRPSAYEYKTTVLRLTLLSQFNYVFKFVAFTPNDQLSFKVPHNIFHKPPPPSSPYNSFPWGPNSSFTWLLSLALTVGIVSLHQLWFPTYVWLLFPLLSQAPESLICHLGSLMLYSSLLSSIFLSLFFLWILPFPKYYIISLLFCTPSCSPTHSQIPKIINLCLRVPSLPLSLTILILFMPVHIPGCFCTLFYNITTLFHSP